MKKAIYLILALSQVTVALADNEALSTERQRDIVELYQYVTGQRTILPTSLANMDENERPPIRCGTIAILDLLDNYDRIDPALLARSGLMLGERPSLAFFYDPPLGKMRIHYATAGEHKVRDAEIDLNSNSIPDYVESIGVIADSVYTHTIDSLGYPLPLTDTTCSNGGDEKIDIYLTNLGAGVFGLTWPDSLCPPVSSVQHVPSWIELDNDYTSITAYVDRPLDAVRVTLAHEFFHVIHFTVDLTESREFFEMTAVWMEEQQYDNINDYYSMLPFYFLRPRRSLQSKVEWHHYASGIFPLYLTENYGPDIVRHVWLRAGELGIGTDWLQAVDEALDSATTGEESLASAVQEFALWNYFTGPYADQAPNDIGYSEKEFYPAIPVERMQVIESYPGFLIANDNPMPPELNGAAYLRFENIQSILTPEFWQCDSGSFDTTCYDSSYVVDTFFNVFFSLSRSASNWGITIIPQLESAPDSHLITGTIIPADGDLSIDLPGIDDFSAITMIFTPTTNVSSTYQTYPLQGLGYFLYDSSEYVGPDPALVDLPAAILVPYPNPAIVPQMGVGPAADKGQNVWFRFEIPTDSQADLIYFTPIFRVDLYTVAGELVRTVEVEVIGNQLDRDTGPPVIGYETSWDMKNENGEDVASGVYLVYGHLYSNADRDDLIAENRTKVVIIR